MTMNDPRGDMDARDRMNPERRRVVSERPGWVTPAIIGALLLAGLLAYAASGNRDRTATTPAPETTSRSERACPAGGAAACQPERHHATSRAGGAAAAINRDRRRQPDHSRPRLRRGLRCWTDSHAARARKPAALVRRPPSGRAGPLRHSPGAVADSCCSLSL